MAKLEVFDALLLITRGTLPIKDFTYKDTTLTVCLDEPSLSRFGPIPMASLMGRDESFYIGINEAAIELPHDQLDAIIAHEMGHFVLGHSLDINEVKRIAELRKQGDKEAIKLEIDADKFAYDTAGPAIIDALKRIRSELRAHGVENKELNIRIATLCAKEALNALVKRGTNGHKDSI